MVEINNHNFPWVFILVTQIHNSPWALYMFTMSFGKMNSVTNINGYHGFYKIDFIDL